MTRPACWAAEVVRNELAGFPAGQCQPLARSLRGRPAAVQPALAASWRAGGLPPAAVHPGETRAPLPRLSGLSERMFPEPAFGSASHGLREGGRASAQTCPVGGSLGEQVLHATPCSAWWHRGPRLHTCAGITRRATRCPSDFCLRPGTWHWLCLSPPVSWDARVGGFISTDVGCRLGPRLFPATSACALSPTGTHAEGTVKMGPGERAALPLSFLQETSSAG